MPDNPGRSALLHAVTLAIGDPGSVVGPRESGDESVPDWRARAVLEAVRPFLAGIDEADRPHVEEARRLLAAFAEGSLPASAFGTERVLYDCGRTLLGVLDKIAPNGEAGD